MPLKGTSLTGEYQAVEVLAQVGRVKVTLRGLRAHELAREHDQRIHVVDGFDFTICVQQDNDGRQQRDVFAYGRGRAVHLLAVLLQRQALDAFEICGPLSPPSLVKEQYLTVENMGH